MSMTLGSREEVTRMYDDDPEQEDSLGDAHEHELERLMDTYGHSSLRAVIYKACTHDR